MSGLRDQIDSWANKDWYKRAWVHEGINCQWCVSFWIGLMISTLSRRSPIYGLALSAFSMIVYKQFFSEAEELDG